MRMAVLLTVLMCLIGCASSGGHFEPAQVRPEEAVIYVFRASNRHLRQSPIQVFVNQQQIGELYPGEYLAHVAPAGEFLVRAESNTSMVRSVKLAAGDSVIMQVTTGTFDKKPVLEIPETEIARRLIAGTRRAAP